MQCERGIDGGCSDCNHEAVINWLNSHLDEVRAEVEELRGLFQRENERANKECLINLGLQGKLYDARAEIARLRDDSEEFLCNVTALCSHRGPSPESIEGFDPDDKWIADLWRTAETRLSNLRSRCSAHPIQPAAQQGESSK